MSTLLELKEKAKSYDNKEMFGIECKFVIISISETRKQFVKCYKCNNYEMITDPTKFVDKCPKCGVTNKDKPGCTFNITTYAIVDDGTFKAGLDLWNTDITRFKVGDTVKIINGICKYKMTKDADGNLTVENLFLQKQKGKQKGILELVK